MTIQFLAVKRRNCLMFFKNINFIFFNVLPQWYVLFNSWFNFLIVLYYRPLMWFKVSNNVPCTSLTKRVFSPPHAARYWFPRIALKTTRACGSTLFPACQFIRLSLERWTGDSIQGMLPPSYYMFIFYNTRY